VLASYPTADVSIDRIGNLLDADLNKLIAAGIPRPIAPPEPRSARRPDVGGTR
jgi:hypothetical protein